MRINTNVAALNSYNQLKQTNQEMDSSLEKLSSGQRINKAADDAAGLAISEKMKSQTKGLAQAQRNAQDGISMIQTAEGALKESHAILQRMRELSVQSANDTNTSEDRAEIQKEVDELASELTRISNNTEFNTQTLLNGAVNKDNNDILKRIGIKGNILFTPGHTIDSISLLMTDGSLFCGDLAANLPSWLDTKYCPPFVTDLEQLYKSWQKIIDSRAQKIYPAHGEPFEVEKLRSHIDKYENEDLIRFF